MKPVLCNYYVTYRCNARCGFCSVWREPVASAQHEASPAVVCRNLDDLKLLGVRIVDFTGGEPLLYDGLPRVLAHAKRAGLRTTVTTNGIRYPDRARELAGLIDILQLSLEGADRESHDLITGTPSFDRVMESVELARSLGERPTFIHTVTDENISRVPEVIALARSMGVLLFLNPCFSYFGNGSLSRENALKLGTIVHGRGVVIDRGFLRFFLDGGNRVLAPRCLAVSSTVVISPDDRLLLPCYHHRTKELPIEGRLLDLRQSPEVQEVREREGWYPFCEGCAVNCYIRASLFRRLDRYFVPTVFSAGKYIWEFYRQRNRKSYKHFFYLFKKFV